MINTIALFWQRSDKYILIPAAITTISLFVILTVFAAAYPLLPPKLPLFYSLPWGEAELATKQQFLLLPAILVLITLTNILIASQLHAIQHVLKKILTISTIAIDLIILITVLKILFIFV